MAQQTVDYPNLDAARIAKRRDATLPQQGFYPISTSFITPEGAAGTTQVVWDDALRNPPPPFAPITLILKIPVTIPSSLPVNLDALGVQLVANTSYDFTFRITKFNSPVPTNISFVAPGDDPPDPAQDAEMAWNNVVLDGVELEADDAYQVTITGNNRITQEFSGTIKTNALTGFFIPQVAQSVTDVAPTIIQKAFLEVKESGN